MPTMRLIPSAYQVSSTQYVTTSNPTNVYSNVDSTTYGQFTHNRNRNNTYYVYLYGFNFDDLPEEAEVSSFTVKIRALESGLSTSSSYRVRLYNGSNVISNTTASTSLGTSAATITIPTGSLTWSQIVGYGNNFRIAVPLYRASQNTSGYVRIYGAEIEVTYTVPTYYTVAATSSVSGITLTPSTQSIMEGNSATITIPVNDISDYLLTDNNIDVTSSAVRHANQGTSTSATFIPSSFDSTNSVYNHNAGTDGVYSTNYINNGLTNHNSTTRCALYAIRTNGTESKMYYNFNCSTIPANAIIDSVSCQIKAGSQGSSYYSAYQAYLCSGTTTKTSAVSITGSNSSPSTQTISGGTWTRSDLNNIKILFQVTANSSTDDSTWSFFGATLTVDYSVPANGYYYTYTINNVQAQHAVLLEEAGVYIPPEEDPNYTYWPITISSINATTDPPTGTVRVVEGTNQTITISPTDPLLTIALDNGVDITSQLVGGAPSNTYTVTTQTTGASHGFQLNNNTGYYVSNNAAASNSAAVCRVNFNFETSCLVTIQYINYAEATYDYGIFGAIDTALGTTYTADSGAYYTCSQSSDNTSTPQTLTYTIPAGTHYIDIKYRKDNYTDSNNDTLQWKIIDITPTGAGADYTYTLTNVNQKHSLIFVFGDVTYYFITSSGSSGGRLFPDGQQVKLPGDSYTLNIVPDSTSSSVTITDNGVNVSANLQQEVGVDKNNNTVVSYRYTLNNIQAAHTLVVSIGGAVTILYFKDGGVWRTATKAYKKINGSWVEQSDLTSVFNINSVYKKG